MLPKSKNNDGTLKKTWERQEKLVLLSCAINENPKPDDGFFRSSHHYIKVSQDGIQSHSQISTLVCFQVSPFDLTTHINIATCELRLLVNSDP